MASFGDGKIEAYVGPLELGAADNLETVIVDFIGGAKKTLDIAIQEIDSRTIAQAILDARWRGVRVQMFIEFLSDDTTYAREESASADEVTKGDNVRIGIDFAGGANPGSGEVDASSVTITQP